MEGEETLQEGNLCVRRLLLMHALSFGVNNMKFHLLAATAALMLVASPVSAQTAGNTSGTASDSGTNATGMNAAGQGTAVSADRQAILQQMSQVTKAKDFVTFAAMSDLFETESGDLAKDEAQGPMAQRIARRIVRDHTRSSRQLMALAKRENIDVEAPTQLDDRHQQMLDALNSAGDDSEMTTSSTSAPDASTSGSSDNAAGNSASNNTAATSTTTPNAGGSDANGMDMGSNTGMTFDQLFAQQQVQAHEEGIALFRAYSQNGDNAQLKQFAAKGLPILERHLKMARNLVRAQDRQMQKNQQQQSND
jgi:predicted outer membrane protein